MVPEVGLSRPRVVKEARQLAETVDLDKLTMSALADHLGVKAPSLYKHIGPNAELHRVISRIACQELGNEVDRASRGRTGSSAFYAISHAARNWAIRYPGLYRASHVPPAPGDPQHHAIVGAIARTFATAIDSLSTMDTPAKLDRVRGTRAALHGFIALETTRSFGLDTDIDRSFDRTIHALVAAFNWDSSALTHGAEPLSRSPTDAQSTGWVQQ
jgi:AcrR family transcriptional regulator